MGPLLKELWIIRWIFPHPIRLISDQTSRKKYWFRNHLPSSTTGNAFASKSPVSSVGWIWGIFKMSLAPPTSPYPFPKSCLPNHLSSSTQSSSSHPKLFPPHSLFHLSFSTSFSTLQSLKPSPFIARASDIGLRDSVHADQPGDSADKTGLFTHGDKVTTIRFLFHLPFLCPSPSSALYPLPTPLFPFQFKLCFLNLAHYDHHVSRIKELMVNLG